MLAVTSSVTSTVASIENQLQAVKNQTGANAQAATAALEQALSNVTQVGQAELLGAQAFLKNTLTELEQKAQTATGDTLTAVNSAIQEVNESLGTVETAL